MWVRRPQGMNLLFVSSEGIQIEEGPWAGRTGQPNTQIGLANMDTNGCMRGGWSFTAPLNLALVDLYDAPHIPTKWCHVSGDSNLQGLRWPRREPPVSVCPLSYRSGGFQISIIRLLRGWFGHSDSGGSSTPLDRRLGH